MDLPFDHLAVYDRDLNFQQALTDPVEVVLSPTWTLGTGELTIAGDDPILPFMQADGARLVATYKGEHLISGWLYQYDGTIEDGGDVRFGLYSDEYLLAWTQGWVVPGGQLAPSSLSDPGQTGTGDGAGYYAWAGDLTTAEAALKRIVWENFQRWPEGDLRRRTTFLADQGRGGDPRPASMLPSVRFDALDEALLPLREWANLGIRLWQEPEATRLLCDVYTPRTWDLPLSSASGTLTDGTFSIAGPTATRGVLGGTGDNADRALDSFVDQAAEKRLGFGIETFVDATGASLKWPEGLDETQQIPKYYLLRDDVAQADKDAFRTYFRTAATKALSDHAAKASASVSLSETESFSYGGPEGYHIGDLITIGTSAVDVQERISGVTVTYNADEFSVVPTVGDGSADDADQATAQLARAVRDLALAARKRATRQ